MQEIIQTTQQPEEIKTELAQQDVKVEEIKAPEPAVLQDLFCSIDVGMVKMAYCIMDRKYKILESVTLSIKPENTTSKKRTMIEYEMGIIANLNAMIDDIIFRFNPNQFIIELQIGKYSAKNIEYCLIQAIMFKSKAQMTLLNPRCKLSLKFCEFTPNEHTKKYNQNKNQSVANCKSWLEINKQEIDKIDRDQSDAILHNIPVECTVDESE